MKTELEEAAEKYCLINNIPTTQMIVKTDRSCEFETPVTMFLEGANYQAERMYSEEEVLELLPKFAAYTLINADEESRLSLKEWFEQFKKK
jgi:hypothetical protein